ncbi:M28 family peptidase [Consotaella salsifontis]|uniref:Zn-dependent amino-or carboxypeptidase, M28 family n=1 Tax=Consotaella salsifontis TaxID=1365950 RepID=A0A1T4S9E5_9HYPH|nr:M28 family peptidase [Consotaella salsifontis]SKA24528.1 Zn-dependent amino-or carboxypeptidase, M28 family [Consotaella salsifontis]
MPMPDAVSRALCEQVSADLMMEALGELQHWVKLSGSAEELTSLELVRKRIETYGYRTEIILHDAMISLPGAARLETGGRTWTCITHSHARPTPAGGLTAPLVDVGEGSQADFDAADVRGRVVLVAGLASPAVTARASAAGAAGQIHFTRDGHIHEMCVSPVWGSPSVETVDRLPCTVVVTVGLDDGEELRAMLRDGRLSEVTLFAEVDTGWRKTPILIAEMEAPEAPEDAPFVLFSGHHDTWYYGVMDNGAANATMLEVARLMASRHADWKRGLRFAFWSGHSHGRYSGSAWYADHHWDELERRCVAHVNVDSTGGRDANILTGSGCAAELRQVAIDAIRDQAGQTYKGKRFGRQGDESFWGVGVPSIFNSISHHAQNVGAEPGAMKLGWWWHTPQDTLDKIDAQNLVRDTRIFVQVVSRLLFSPVLPLDYRAHAADLRSVLSGLGEELGDRFDMSELMARLDEFSVLAERTAATAERSASSEQAERLNRALLRTSRALVPMDYTQGDRFVHDPALAQAAWPVLQPLRALARSAPEGAEAALCYVSARRAANRMAHALRSACETLAGC